MHFCPLVEVLRCCWSLGARACHHWADHNCDRRGSRRVRDRDEAGDSNTCRRWKAGIYTSHQPSFHFPFVPLLLLSTPGMLYPAGVNYHSLPGEGGFSTDRGIECKGWSFEREAAAVLRRILLNNTRHHNIINQCYCLSTLVLTRQSPFLSSLFSALMSAAFKVYERPHINPVRPNAYGNPNLIFTKTC